MKLPLILLALAGPVAADPIREAITPSGRLTLYTEQGPCVHTARLAVWTYEDGRTVAGCWVASPTQVLVSFLDGDRADVPLSAFAPVKRT